MILLRETAIELLRAGGSLRLSTRGVMPNTMVDYARAAHSSGAKVTFVVEGVVIPDTMI
jgi:hypothetical protein